jgi:hypothetical protein
LMVRNDQQLSAAAEAIRKTMLGADFNRRLGK